MAENIIRVQSLPGIKRDGTRFEGDQYVDGQWVRFQRGLPRKIGGYRSINKYLQGLPRTLHEYTQDLLTYIHAGSANLVERFYIDGSYNVSTIVDRTPASGFTANDGNLWQFDTIYSASGSTNQIIAQVAPNLSCICNSEGGEVFIGDLLGTSALTPVTLASGASASGGVVSLHPYAFVFGNDGSVSWSVAGDPSDFTSAGSGKANITGQKIVRGMPLRGGPGSSPSGLFWSADSLLRASFVGGDTIFQFDTISSQSSIMSAQSVIEYDGIFYWLGADRFLMFNGVVREIENNLNANFFFQNMNYAYRQTVFAIKVPRFGEIWWCFPFGTSTEPNHAIIYNVREGTWYDTPLPNGGRGAGVFPSVFRRPLMSGVEAQAAIITDVAIVDGGTGYTLGDVLTFEDQLVGLHGEVTVTGETAGVITDVSISNAGQYTVLPENPVSVSGGTGADATFDLTFLNPYKFWVHEVGVDEVDGLTVNPIQSFFETADISIPVQSQTNGALQVLMIEPDFVQSGNMTCAIHGRANARSQEVESEPRSFPAEATDANDEVLYFKEQRRELRFRFESNTVGGDYQMGLVLAHVQKGDGRTTS